MKNFLFINSHLASGEEQFIAILNRNPRIDIKRHSGSYQTPLDVFPAIRGKHKLGRHKGIYGDHLLFNYLFSCDTLLSSCKFIYLVRHPKQTLPLLVPSYSWSKATDYYCFRLRRLAEMAKHTPDSLLFTWDDLAAGKGMDLITSYLNLIEPVIIPNEVFVYPPDQQSVPPKLLATAEEAYEKYLYCLRNRLKCPPQV